MADDILTFIPALRTLSRVLCSTRADAEDLVQETLLRAIEYADHYQPGTNMRAWLLKIMRNRFYTKCHLSARERTGSDDCVSLTPSVKPTQEWHLQLLEMRAALHALPDPYRDAIVLVGVLGESYIDAAEILDCDIGTIKSRVSRARSMLRSRLEAA